MAVSSDTLRLGVVEESTTGSTPSTPTYDLMRTTGEGLIYEVNTTNSAEMGGVNRGIKDNILTGAQVTGEINFELSKHKALETLMAASLGNDWAGDPLSVPGAGTDKVYNAFEARTFTLEKRFTLNDTPTYAYHRFTGCMVDVMNFSITPNEPITGSFEFIGNEMTTETAEVSGSTYTLAGTGPIMTAPLVTGIELLSPHGINDSTGVPLGSPVAWASAACFTSLEIAINNNVRGLQCIGTLGNKETVLGQFAGTASGVLLYSGDEPLDALIAQTEYALRVTCTDDSGENFQFLFPRVVFAEASAPATSTNTDVEVPFTMNILEYQGNNYAVSTIITRTSPAVASALAPASASSMETEDA